MKGNRAIVGEGCYLDWGSSGMQRSVLGPLVFVIYIDLDNNAVDMARYGKWN